MREVVTVAVVYARCPPRRQSSFTVQGVGGMRCAHSAGPSLTKTASRQTLMQVSSASQMDPGAGYAVSTTGAECFYGIFPTQSSNGGISFWNLKSFLESHYWKIVSGKQMETFYNRRRAAQWNRVQPNGEADPTNEGGGIPNVQTHGHAQTYSM